MNGKAGKTPSGLSKEQTERATADFRRMMKWIVAIGVAATIAALVYLGVTGELTLSMVIAVVAGVFFSVLLGCGLFAASFFSDKSGHDQMVTDATRRDLVHGDTASTDDRV
jgi:fatty acid desaturase